MNIIINLRFIAIIYEYPFHILTKFRSLKKVANFFDNGNYWLTLWLTENTILYIQPKKEQKCQAHNLKVVGSNPTPATNYINKINDLDHPQRLRFLGFFCVLSLITITEWLTKWLTLVRHSSLFIDKGLIKSKNLTIITYRNKINKF